jgi:hypothetical protein
MKKLSNLVAWLHASDFRIITFWIVICGGILIILITLAMTDVFDSLTTTEVGGPVARCGIRWIAGRIPTQAGQHSDDCGQPVKPA